MESLLAQLVFVLASPAELPSVVKCGGGALNILRIVREATRLIKGMGE